MTRALRDQIQALLDLDASGALVPHGIGGHARELFERTLLSLASRSGVEGDLGSARDLDHTAGVKLDERDRFEEWAAADNRDLAPEMYEDRTPDNGLYYITETTNAAYIGWRERASLSNQTEAAPQAPDEPKSDGSEVELTDDEIRTAYAAGMRAVPGPTHARPCDDRDIKFVRGMLAAISRRPSPPTHQQSLQVAEDVGELIGATRVAADELIRCSGEIAAGVASAHWHDWLEDVAAPRFRQAANALEALAKQRAEAEHTRDYWHEQANLSIAHLSETDAKLASAEREGDQWRAAFDAIQTLINMARENGGEQLVIRTMDAEAHRDRLQERLERVESLLRPFAAHVGKSGEPVVLKIGADSWTASLTTDHFEAARAYFNEQPQAGEPK